MAVDTFASIISSAPTPGAQHATALNRWFFNRLSKTWSPRRQLVSAAERRPRGLT